MFLAVNTIAVFLYLISCASILRTFRMHAIMLTFLLFSQFWSVISCYYNDLGVYNFELFQYTEPSFGTTWLVLFYLAFNFGFSRAGRMLQNKSISIIDFWMPGFISLRGVYRISTYIIFAAITFYVIYNFEKNGMTLYSNISRVEAKREADFIGRMLLNYGFIFAFALGYFRNENRILVFDDLLLAILLVHFISIGHKFSGLIVLLACYFSPLWARRLKSNPNAGMVNKKIFIAIVIGLFVALYGAIAQYDAATNSSEVANQILMDRIFAAQGHLWWAVNSQTFPIDHSHWVTELKAILLPGTVPEESTGMKYLMVKILGWDKAGAIFDVGYLYTMAYPAILLASVPVWIGLIIQILSGAFFFILLNYLNFAINCGHFIRSVIAVLIVIPFISTLFAGVLVTFATIGVVAKIVLLFILNLKGFWSVYRRTKIV